MKPDRLTSFAVGGVVGATVRWVVVGTAPHGALDWGVLIVNTVGSLLLGMIAALALHPERRTEPAVIAVGAGFCGSLTTFSTLAVSVAGELRDGSTPTGLVRLGVSLAAGLVAASVGWHLTARALVTTTQSFSGGIVIVTGFLGLALVGTLARVLIGHVLNRPDLPIGTLAVNIAGAFLLGLLVGAGASTDTLTVVGTGALGSFTTFSALSHETAWMVRRHRVRRSLIYLTTTVGVGVGAAWLGLAMAG